MQKLREKPTTSIAARQCLFHTHESITPFSLQSFFIPTIKRLQQYYNSQRFNPTLTSLEEEMVALFIAKIGNLAQGGRNSQGERDWICMWSESKPNMSLSKYDMSLIQATIRAPIFKIQSIIIIQITI